MSLIDIMIDQLSSTRMFVEDGGRGHSSVEDRHARGLLSRLHAV